MERGLSCLRFPSRMAAPSGAVAVSIVTGARTFSSPFGMTYMQWREDADLADSGPSVLRVALVLFRSTERSLSEVQSATELPCFLTVKSLRQCHAKGVLLPQYVAEGGRHSGFIPLARESGMREGCNIVARSRFGKPSARSPRVCSCVMSRLTTFAQRHGMSSENRRPCFAQRDCQPGDRFRDATTADEEGCLFFYSNPSASSSAVSSVPSLSSPVDCVSVRSGTALWESVGATDMGIPNGLCASAESHSFDGAADSSIDAESS